MPAPVSSIKYIGPSFEAQFAKVGINSAEDLRNIGADAAYGRLLEVGNKPHFIAYYALVMALQGRPWNDCKGKEKDALRDRFDQLKATYLISEDVQIENILNEIGVLKPTQKNG